MRSPRPSDKLISDGQIELNNPRIRVTSSSSALAGRLARLSTSAVSDVLDHCGYPEQSVASAIAPLSATMKMAGVAVCFEGVDESDAAHRSLTAISGFEIDRRMDPGAVLVIAMSGHRMSAAVGGLMALSAQRRGCSGFVVDGGVRDAPEISALGLPTFCRYVTPLNSSKRWRLTRAGGAIALPGQAVPAVSVSPGDFLIGDGDGLMVIPQTIAEDVIGWTERLTEIEEAIVRRIEAGASREEAFEKHPRFAHIRRLRP
jgi:4-hydroxy-4-methyl-2-oxoglutarate aldolase